MIWVQIFTQHPVKYQDARLSVLIEEENADEPLHGIT
jgi:hypothetical protein